MIPTKFNPPGGQFAGRGRAPSPGMGTQPMPGSMGPMPSPMSGGPNYDTPTPGGPTVPAPGGPNYNPGGNEPGYAPPAPGGMAPGIVPPAPGGMTPTPNVQPPMPTPGAMAGLARAMGRGGRRGF